MGRDLEQGKTQGAAWEPESKKAEGFDFRHGYQMTEAALEQLWQTVIRQIRREFLGAPQARAKNSVPALSPLQNSTNEVAPTAAPGKNIFERTSEATERNKIANSLDAVTVHETKTATQLLDAGEIFEMYPWNNHAKQKAFEPLRLAAKKVRDAKTPEQKQTAEADFAKGVESVKAFLIHEIPKMLKNDKDYKDGAHRLAQLKKQIVQAKKTGNAEATDQGQELWAAEQAQFQDLVAATETKLRKQIETIDVRLVPYERTSYQIKVDGEAIHLQDGQEAYCAVSLQGLAGGVKNEHTTVRKTLDESSEKTSAKKILLNISNSEGSFSTVNMYDKKQVTWGFVQWAGGHGSDLATTMAMMKNLGLNTFQKRFTNYGIDVVKVPQGWDITVKTPEGELKQGDEAAEYIKNSPKLTAVMARAGADPVVQRAQVRAAVSGQIERPLRQAVHLNYNAISYPVRLEQIFTSEYSVGVLADRVTHGGLDKPKLAAAIQSWLDKKGYNPTKVSDWAAEAESELAAVVIDGWAARAKGFEETCSKQPGSYK